MTRRYATVIGFTGVGTAFVSHWIVVQADDAREPDLLARGFSIVPESMSLDEIKARYGVSIVYTLVESTIEN